MGVKFGELRMLRTRIGACPSCADGSTRVARGAGWTWGTGSAAQRAHAKDAPSAARLHAGGQGSGAGGLATREQRTGSAAQRAHAKDAPSAARLHAGGQGSGAGRLAASEQRTGSAACMGWARLGGRQPSWKPVRAKDCA